MDLLGVIAGEFEPAILEIWGPDAATGYLTADKMRRHLWHICLAYGAPRDRVLLERSTARSLLKACVGQIPGLRGLLTKLGPFAWTMDDYRLLVRVTKEGDPGAKMLRHAGSIDAGLIRRLALLPRDLRRTEVDRICPNAISVHYLEWLIRRGTAYGLTFDPAKAARFQVMSWWRLYECFTHPNDGFPPPPFVPDGFVPLGDRRALADAAKRFQNCLSSLDASVIDGKAYCFTVDGTHPAVVMIERIAPFGWRVADALGVGNQPLPRPARDAIAAALAVYDVFVGSLFEEEEN